MASTTISFATKYTLAEDDDLLLSVIGVSSTSMTEELLSLLETQLQYLRSEIRPHNVYGFVLRTWFPSLAMGFVLGSISASVLTVISLAFPQSRQWFQGVSYLLFWLVLVILSFIAILAKFVHGESHRYRSAVHNTDLLTKDRESQQLLSVTFQAIEVVYSREHSTAITDLVYVRLVDSIWITLQDVDLFNDVDLPPSEIGRDFILQRLSNTKRVVAVHTSGDLVPIATVKSTIISLDVDCIGKFIRLF